MIKTFAQLKKIAATSLTLAAILLSNTAVADGSAVNLYLGTDFKEPIVVSCSNGQSYRLESKEADIYGTFIPLAAQSARYTAPSFVGYAFKGWYRAADVLGYYTSIPSTVSTYSYLVSSSPSFVPDNSYSPTACLFSTNTTTPGFTSMYLAKYEEETYTVEFENNSEETWSQPKSLTATGGETIKLPDVSGLQSGVTFYGWYSDPSFTTTTKIGDSGEVYQPTKSQTLYAKIVRDSYTVSFDANGGTGTMSAQTMPCGLNATLTENSFERAGYSFLGWARTNSSSSANYADKASVNLSTKKDDKITLYAVWGANTYEVVYDYNDGSGTKKTMSQTYNAYYVLPATPTRSGYTFAGWWTEEVGGSNVTSDQKYAYASGCTLYAHWGAIEYQLSFDGYSEYNRYINYGDKYGKDGWPEPEKVGYTFIGWYSGSTLITADTIYSQMSGQTLSPRFSPKTYQVSTDNANCKISAPSNGSFDSEIMFTVVGDDIPGYSTEYVSTSITADDPVLGSIDLTASATITSRGGYFTMKGRYYESILISVLFSKTAKTFQLRFDSNGGSSVAAQVVTYDSAYGELPEPTREGYRFAGWWTDRTGGEEIAAESTVKILETTTLYAHWNYSISFDKGAESAEGEMERLTAQCGQKVKLPACVYTRLGYQFVGWSFGESLFADEAEIDELKFSGEEAVLTAKWEEIRQNIAFDANWNGPAGSLVTTTVPDQFELKYGEKKTVYWKPVNTIAEFLGWAFESDAKDPYFAAENGTAEIEVLSAETAITLYAVWKKNGNTALVEAVGCDNLILASADSSKAIGKAGAWKPISGGGGIESGVIEPDASFIGRVTSLYSEVTTVLPQAGRLVFRWRVRDINGGRSCFMVDSKEVSGVTATKSEGSVVYTNTADTPISVAWRAYGVAKENPSNLVITSVRWYPAGVNPEPTPADAPVISSDYSFVADSMFDYVIEAKDALTETEWTTVNVVTGDGSEIPLPMTPTKEHPQRFLRVRVIQRGAQ